MADFFKGRIAPGRPVPPERSVPRQQSPARSHRPAAGLRRRARRCSGPSTARTSTTSAGATHGAYNPGATEIWQEGIRITPLKLYDARRPARRRAADGGDQRAPPARLPGRPAGDDGLGPPRGAAAAQAGGRLRPRRGARDDRRDPRRGGAAEPRVHPSRATTPNPPAWISRSAARRACSAFPLQRTHTSFPSSTPTASAEQASKALCVSTRAAYSPRPVEAASRECRTEVRPLDRGPVISFDSRPRGKISRRGGKNIDRLMMTPANMTPVNKGKSSRHSDIRLLFAIPI